MIGAAGADGSGYLEWFDIHPLGLAVHAQKSRFVSGLAGRGVWRLYHRDARYALGFPFLLLNLLLFSCMARIFPRDE
jgi:hypothetical protein